LDPIICRAVLVDGNPRKNAFVGLLLRLVFICAVAVIEVPEHLALIKRIDLPPVTKHCERAPTLLDFRRDVVVVQEIT
jgi:hypothetical protein